MLYSSVQCVAMDWTDSAVQYSAVQWLGLWLAVQYSALDSAVQWLGLAEIKAGHDGGLTSPLLPWPHLSLLNIIFIVTVFISIQSQTITTFKIFLDQLSPVCTKYFTFALFREAI